MMKWTVMSALFAGAVVGSAQAGISSNGGFESGSGADADNWTQLEIFGGTGGANAIADRVAGMGHTGDYAMELSVVGALDFGPVAEIQQQTTVGSVVGGQEYTFSFWSMGTSGPGSVAFYEVSWFDGDGSNGGGPQGSATGLQVFAMTGSYSQITLSGLIAPSAADSVFIQIRLVTGAFEGASGQLFVDDVSFSAVPAPGAAALLGMGGLVASRRRRA